MGEDGRVLTARQANCWVLRFEGAIRYASAPAVDAFLDTLFAQEPPDSICIDLNQATSIDSTGIGLLAKIANGLKHAGKPRPVVFCENPEITELLCSLCLDDVCTIRPGSPATLARDVIPADTFSERALAQTVLEAHRLLSELSESNRASFRSVVDAFARDLAGK